MERNESKIRSEGKKQRTKKRYGLFCRIIAENDNGFQDSEDGIIAIGKTENTYIIFSSKGEKGEKGDKGDKGDDGKSVDLTPVWNAIAEKTSKTEGIPFFRSAYNPEHAEENDYQKVLSFNLGSFLVFNITQYVFGSTAQNTLWISAQNSPFICSVFDWGFVCKVDYERYKCDLYIPTYKYNTPAVTSMLFQIVQQFDEIEDVEWYNEEAVFERVENVQTARIIYKPEPPAKENSLQFDVAGSTSEVNMGEAFDYIGNVTGEVASTTINVTNEKESSIYRFAFTVDLTEGFSIYSTKRGVTYCSVDSVKAGDIITITSVSNTEGGWVASIQKPSIAEEDGSVKVIWKDGTAFLKANVSSEDLIDDGYLVAGSNITNIDENGVITTNISDGGVSTLKGKVLMSQALFNNWIRRFKPMKNELIYNFVDGPVFSDDGELVGWEGFTNVDLQTIKGFEIMTYEFFKKWCDEFKPAKKGEGGGGEKKIYIVDSLQSYKIPDDADVVIFDRTKIEDNPSTTSVWFYLPKIEQAGKSITIINSFPNSRLQTSVTKIRITVSNNGSTSITKNIEQGSSATFWNSGITSPLSAWSMII